MVVEMCVVQVRELVCVVCGKGRCRDSTWYCTLLVWALPWLQDKVTAMGKREEYMGYIRENGGEGRGWNGGWAELGGDKRLDLTCDLDLGGGDFVQTPSWLTRDNLSSR